MYLESLSQGNKRYFMTCFGPEMQILLANGKTDIS